jgi:hypothetical protein
MVSLLLEANSNLSLADKNKCTAFDIAAQHGKFIFFDALVDRGAGKEEGGRRKEEGRRKKEEGRRREEGGRGRKEERGRREEG